MEPAVVTSEETSSPSLITRRAKPPAAEKVASPLTTSAARDGALKPIRRLAASSGATRT
jgi:hypothetical protein